MLHKSIIDKIKAKYGRKEIYSADCELIANAINKGYSGPVVSTSTIKRLLGFVGTPETAPTPRANTLDIIAKWLDYDSYKSLLASIGKSDDSSEFTSLHCIEVASLEEGCQIHLRYEPSRMIMMTYLGDGQFVVNEAKNSKLMQGDRLQITHIVLGQEMLVREVVRDGRSLGGYRAGKNGGLTSIEIIGCPVIFLHGQ